MMTKRKTQPALRPSGVASVALLLASSRNGRFRGVYRNDPTHGCAGRLFLFYRQTKRPFQLVCGVIADWCLRKGCPSD
jgi:hypothetical protein